VIAVEYHADLKEVQSDARLSALLSPAEALAPFDRLAWWQNLARHCGLEPLLAVARDGDARAVLPLQTGGGNYAALANWYSFRFRPVVSAEADSAGLLTAIATDIGKRKHRITLAGLPDEDGSATLVERAFRQAGWITFREECDTNHVLHVGGRSYDEYIATRPGQLRTTLKRKSGKVRTEVLTRFDAALWDAYEAIYRESWKPSEGSPEFLRAFAEAEGEAGRLRFAIAHDPEGRAVAAQMWTVEGGTAFIHKLAHLESAKPLSPGSVLSAALFRHVIDVDKVDVVDFGTGDNPYKRDWMEEVRPRYRLDMLRPLAPENWLIIARTGLRRLAGKRKHG
jgi:CelD/BcsL family acetyltransferase involved in cellulose biosynthesis